METRRVHSRGDGLCNRGDRGQNGTDSHPMLYSLKARRWKKDNYTEEKARWLAKDKDVEEEGEKCQRHLV